MAGVRPGLRRARLAEFPLGPGPGPPDRPFRGDLYAVGAHAFGLEARDLACAFASYAAVAVGNMHLYETTRQRAEHLEIAMQTRAVIEQAKGILMAQRRCDAAEAFNILAAASQRANRKLREIAAAIVAGVAERPQ